MNLSFYFEFYPKFFFRSWKTELLLWSIPKSTFLSAALYGFIVINWMNVATCSLTVIFAPETKVEELLLSRFSLDVINWKWTNSNPSIFMMGKQVRSTLAPAVNPLCWHSKGDPYFCMVSWLCFEFVHLNVKRTLSSLRYFLWYTQRGIDL